MLFPENIIRVAKRGTHRRRTAFFLAQVVALGIFGGLEVAPVHATDRFWNAATGDWFDTSPWLTNIVPTSSDQAFISNAGTVTISSGSAVALKTIIGSGGGSGTLSMTGGSLAGPVQVGTGSGSVGTVIQSNGTMLGTVTLGDFTGVGHYQLSGGSVSINSVSTNSDFTQTGGTSSIFDCRGTFSLALGTASAFASYKSFTQTGGTFSSSSTIFYGGTNTLSGGTQTVGDFTHQGGTTTVSDTITVNATNSLKVLGGSYYQTGGAVTTALLAVGQKTNDFINQPMSGFYWLSGGTLTATSLTVTKDLAFFSSGATFAQTGGSAHFGSVSVGALSTYSFSGGSLQIDNSWSGSGTFDFNSAAVTVTAGTVSTPVNITLTSASLLNTGSATLTVLNPNSLVTMTLAQRNGFASFTNQGITRIPGTTLTIASGQSLTLTGDFADPVSVQGTLTSGGGTLNVLNNGQASGTGTINMGSGLWKFTGSSTIGGTAQVTAGGTYVGFNGNGSLNITGGTLTSPMFVGSGSGATGTVTQSAGTVTGTVTVGHNSGTGNYQLSGGSVSVGTISTASNFTQSGGTSSVFEARGSFSLSAGTTSLFSTYSNFTQTGGTLSSSNTIFYTGTNSISGGAQSFVDFTHYGTSTTLSGSATVNTSHNFKVNGGNYNQTGGTMTAALLAVGQGYNDAINFVTSGTYTLSGGTLNATTMTITHDRPELPAGANFTQSGGTAHLGSLTVGADSTYYYNGGSFLIDTAWNVSGIFNFAGTTTTLTLGSASVPVSLNFSNGSLLNGGNITLHVLNAGSLVQITSAQMAAFASFTNEGITRVPGTLVVAAGQTFSTSGDFIDPIEVQGTFSGTINLLNTAQVTDLGIVNLGTGLWNTNGNSKIAGSAQVTAGGTTIGIGGGTGTLTISGGTLTSPLVAGAGAGSVGTITQTGGTLTGAVALGDVAGGIGYYQLSGGSVTISSVTAGSSFTQSGGTSSVNDCRGSFSIFAGTATLFASYSSFTQTGGTVNGSFTTFFGGANTFSGGTQTHATFAHQGGTTTLSSTANLTVTGNFSVTGGTFNQAAGTVTTALLAIGQAVNDFDGLPHSGTYAFSGGTLNATTLSVTHDLQSFAQGASFAQSGGSAHIASLTVGADSTYSYSGGSLQVDSSWIVNGTFDFAGAAVTLTAGSVSSPATVELVNANLLNTGNATLTVLNAGSFVVVPAGMDLNTLFAAHTNEGTTYQLGSPLIVAAGKSVSISTGLTISDDVTNNGTISTIDSTVTFAGDYVGKNFVSDPSTNIFHKNVTVVLGGLMTGSLGDQFQMSGGTFTNHGTFDNGGLLQSSDATINDGTFIQGGAQTWTAGSTFTNNAGTATFHSDSGSNSASPLAVTVAGGAVTFTTTQHLAGLAIGLGTATVSATGSPAARSILITKSLSFTDSAGKLDLNDNDLIINYDGGTSPFAAIRDQVKLGLNGVAGITSTTGHAAPFDKVLALVDNASHNLTTLSGVTLASLGLSGSNQLLGKYTYFGDANLDGKVTGADYTFIDANLGRTDAGVDWLAGDFNFDGKVTGADYTFIDANLGKGVAAPLAYEELQSEMIALHAAEFGAEYTSALETIQASVPEPATLGVLAAALGLLIGRRSRRARG